MSPLILLFLAGISLLYVHSRWQCYRPVVPQLKHFCPPGFLIWGFRLVYAINIISVSRYLSSQAIRPLEEMFILNWFALGILSVLHKKIQEEFPADPAVLKSPNYIAIYLGGKIKDLRDRIRLFFGRR